MANLTREFLEVEIQTKSIAQIARETGYNRATVARFTKNFRIVIPRRRGGANKDYSAIFTYDFLMDHHVRQQKSMHRISKEIGCDHQTVAHWIHFHEVPYQAPRYADRAMADHPGWNGCGKLSKTRFNGFRNNAKTRNLSFDLTIEQLWDLYLAQDGKCALTGMDIGFTSANKATASLDRIDSTKGYTLHNVWWLHSDVNFAKQSLTVNEFVELCRNVVSHSTKFNQTALSDEGPA